MRAHWEKRLIVGVIAGLFILIGLGTMLGWATHLLSYAPMADATPLFRSHSIVGIALLGISLWIQRKSPATSPSALARSLLFLARFFSALTILLGALSILNEFYEVHSSLDTILNRLHLDIYTFSEGSISLISAICFLLGGASLLIIDKRNRHDHYPAEYLALGIAAVMIAPLIAHLYIAASVIHIPPSLMVPIDIPLLFTLLSVGILVARPSHHFMRNFFNKGPGGQLLRRLLPTAVLFLLALDLLAELGVRHGIYGQEKVSPLVILIDIVVLSILFWRSAFLLNQEHAGRRKGEAVLNKTNELIRVVSDSTTDAIFVKDRQGRLIFANPPTLKIIGKNLDTALDRTNEELFTHHDDVVQMTVSDQRVMLTGEPEYIEQTIHFPDTTRIFYVSKSPWRDASGDIVGVVGIATDITDRKKEEEALKEHETLLETQVALRTAEVSELIGHLQTLREDEKRAIARELHDDLGSSLTALNMHMAIMFQKTASDPTLTERAVQIKALLSSITATTRRIQNGLRPDKLDIFGIKTTLSELASEFETYTGITCKANLPDEDIAYAPPVEIALFRIAQEGLNNIARHAKASQVDLILDDNDEHVSMTIRDNGVGMANDAGSSYYNVHGLRGMRERATYLGGHLDIVSAPGQGTKINVSFRKEKVIAAAGATVA